MYDLLNNLNQSFASWLSLWTVIEMRSHFHQCVYCASLFQFSAPARLHILHMYFIWYGHSISQTLGSCANMCAGVRCSAKKDTGNETPVFRKFRFMHQAMLIPVWSQQPQISVLVCGCWLFSHHHVSLITIAHVDERTFFLWIIKMYSFVSNYLKIQDMKHMENEYV